MIQLEHQEICSGRIASMLPVLLFSVQAMYVYLSRRVQARACEQLIEHVHLNPRSSRPKYLPVQTAPKPEDGLVYAITFRLLEGLIMINRCTSLPI